MTCESWDAIKIDLASHEISPETRAAFEAHAATCAACASDLSAMRAASDLVAKAAGSRAEAVAATANLTLTLPKQRQAIGRWGIAASLALTFAGGYAVRWFAEPERGTSDETIVTRAARDVSLAGEYARLHATSPGLSTIGKGMLGLARR
ncbi:MAG: hypothetical protein HBSAPP03_11650 [Phycisphaerae bacterium]|nr:MAG: hypothetical protein HBSAPP03_11650 [Phycisphaerae bacterium]